MKPFLFLTLKSESAEHSHRQAGTGETDGEERGIVRVKYIDKERMCVCVCVGEIKRMD